MFTTLLVGERLKLSWRMCYEDLKERSECRRHSSAVGSTPSLLRDQSSKVEMIGRPAALNAVHQGQAQDLLAT
jgi:predicted anti-sigma-YlaC factor YlaD